MEEVVADKGYHDNRLLAQCAEWQVRTCIPERKQRKRVWRNKPEELEAAFRANRRRVRGERGKPLNRCRSERRERSFTHVCETGGGRRSWLRGLENVTKAHVMRCAAYNLGLLLRKAFGLVKPRSGAVLFALILVLRTVLAPIRRLWSRMKATFTIGTPPIATPNPKLPSNPVFVKTPSSLTGC